MKAIIKAIFEMLANTNMKNFIHFYNFLTAALILTNINEYIVNEANIIINVLFRTLHCMSEKVFVDYGGKGVGWPLCYVVLGYDHYF